ncbi:hypothetical protein KSP40_PGU007757 [Platanthera guangdongensis]|uniref:Uncharacterized protein n=1 Tax=Platanthera guangdongensis TaxID=2320717 RepID=A0ABR2ME72_9ASPA
MAAIFKSSSNVLVMSCSAAMDLYVSDNRRYNFLIYMNECLLSQEEADDNIVYRYEINHSVGNNSHVLQDIAADHTLPRTKSVRCSVCNHPEAVFFKVSVSAF